MSDVCVVGSFDDLKLADFRFFEEAGRLGRVHALMWSDAGHAKCGGAPLRFPQAEREYLLHAIRYVSAVTIIDGDWYALLRWFREHPPAVWATREAQAGAAAQTLEHFRQTVIPEAQLAGVARGALAPSNPPSTTPTGKKVIVTGCYDYFHSGHLRFFEESAELGDLYVTVGSDDNIRRLKGDGHPLFPADQRRYIVGSIRFVKQAMVATGSGWLDAEPEIDRIRPDIYAVNEDGDKPEKREFCERKGIEYRVLKRLPRPGLLRRASTDLRGF
jgi:cytidyltransferase-like protein